MSWAQKEWRAPRVGEVVSDPDGNIGRVFNVHGELTDKYIWVEDVHGKEIYSGEAASLFTLCETPDIEKFQFLRYSLKGFEIGTICAFKGDLDVPLEIISMKWMNFRDLMAFTLKDLRNPSAEPMVTVNESILTPFNQDIPPLENLFTDETSGLKWRLEINLVEKESPGWSSAGSVWEFLRKEDALAEVERWKSRLKARRIASAMSMDWKVKFPCWVVEVVVIDEQLVTKPLKISNFFGYPSYFKSASHAAYAMKLLPPEEWLRALGYTQDDIF